MDLETSETIVRMVRNGVNSYGDFIAAIPDLDPSEFYGIVRSPCPENNLLAELAPRPHDPAESYRFIPEDRFKLTEHGKNLAYRLAKEDKEDLCIERNFNYQQSARNYAIVSTVAAVISVLLAIWQLLR